MACVLDLRWYRSIRSEELVSQFQPAEEYQMRGRERGSVCRTCVLPSLKISATAFHLCVAIPSKIKIDGYKPQVTISETLLTRSMNDIQHLDIISE